MGTEVAMPMPDGKIQEYHVAVKVEGYKNPFQGPVKGISKARAIELFREKLARDFEQAKTYEYDNAIAMLKELKFIVKPISKKEKDVYED